MMNSYVGQKYGRLTVIEDLGYYKKEGYARKSHWLKCKCDCGNEKITTLSQLTSGKTKSCGCLNREMTINRNRKYNEYYVYEDIVFVMFTNCNEYFICDLEDWEKLKNYCWFKNSGGYAVAEPSRGNRLRFHRLVTNCPDGLEPDHIYPVALGVCDNRKSNLAIKTHRQNCLNTGMFSHNTSGYKGVTFDKTMNKWVAQIGVLGNTIHLGKFNTKEEAYKARLEAEEKYFGEYRRVV